MNNAVAMVLVAALFGAGGQLSLKIGMGQVGRIGTDSLEQPLQIVVRVLTTPFVVGGLGLYVLGAVLWLAILSREQLSFAYPILAVGYAITPTLAWLMLGESVNPLRWLGIATICMGVLLTARS
ncbi:MAG TPA: EamA family transporter [Chloroflexota bacterium]|nr:EamA family transporter [Chloroflexota bacterium]